jgi:hypothetical protein
MSCIIETRYRQMFEKETETYRRLLPKLLNDEGKFVVIYGEELAGIWDTWEDALGEGYARYHQAHFMVKQICEVEPVYTITRLVAPCPT